MLFKGSNVPPELYNFASAIYEDELIIFGGMRGNYRQTKNLYCIQLSDKRTTYEEPQSVDSGPAFHDLNKFDDEGPPQTPAYGDRIDPGSLSAATRLSGQTANAALSCCS